MMMFSLILRRRQCPTILPFFAQHNLFNHISAESMVQNPHPKSLSFNMVDYLTATFGFSAGKAARISKPIAHLKSPEKPDAFRDFLEQQGFSETDIKAIVRRVPDIFCSSLEKILDPNLCALRQLALSSCSLNKIIVSNPQTLRLEASASRITFWRDFLGGDDAALVKAFNLNKGLICLDISRSVTPKIVLLQSKGLSTEDIRKIVCRVPQLMTCSIGLIQDQLKRTVELGFQPGTRMFLVGLEVMMRVTREALQKKMEVLKSFGWAEEELFLALLKQPSMFTLSEENVRQKMNFLLGEARCDISYITFRPVLLQFSLDKRLRPRLHVLHLLELKGLYIKKQSFYTAMHLTEMEFVERYVLPHKDEIPELCDICLK